MIYSIVKGLKIGNNEVWVKECSNNVTPKFYTWEKQPYLTKILKEEGKTALIKEILYLYWSGEYKGPQKYEEVTFIFKKTCRNFKWGCNIPKELIKKALYYFYKTYPKDNKKYIIRQKKTDNYVVGKSRSSLFLYKGKKSAKVFKGLNKAKYYLAYFNMSKYEFIEIFEEN